MRLSVVATKLKFNARGFITQTFKDLRQQFLYAADAFIHAAAAASVVPVDTGMARGSFLNLLQLLAANGLGSGLDIATTPQHLNRHGKMFDYYHNKGKVFRKKKGPQFAKTLSTPRGQIVKRVGDKFTFTYQTKVFHFNLNDEPIWGSYRLGRYAFVTTLQQFKPPQLDKYLIQSTISYGAEFSGQTRLRSRVNRTVL